MRTRVIGVGNLLMADEGVGVHAARRLEEETLPPLVDVLDGGVAGLGLLSMFGPQDKVIFLDCADMGLPPGSVRRFSPAEVRDLWSGWEASLHDTGLLGVLRLADVTGAAPREAVIYGVQPHSLAWSTELSPVCRAALDQLVDQVRAEVGAGGPPVC